MGSQTVRHDWVTELNWTENTLRCPFRRGQHKEAAKALKFKFLKKFNINRTSSSMVSGNGRKQYNNLFSPWPKKIHRGHEFFYCSFQLNMNSQDLTVGYRLLTVLYFLFILYYLFLAPDFIQFYLWWSAAFFKFLVVSHKCSSCFSRNGVVVRK